MFSLKTAGHATWFRSLLSKVFRIKSAQSVRAQFHGRKDMFIFIYESSGQTEGSLVIVITWGNQSTPSYKRRGSGWGYCNLSYQLNFRPFLSYQLISTNISYFFGRTHEHMLLPNAKWFRNHVWYNPRNPRTIRTSRGNSYIHKPFSFSKEIYFRWFFNCVILMTK